MPLRCDYSESDVCPHCNRKGVLGARRMCTDAAQIVTPPKEPGIVRKVYSFCMAKSRWKKAGSPVRTPERVKELLTICQACPNLLGKGEVKQRCGKCGCPINDLPEATKNKLAMATESCPLDPPLWVAEPNH